MGGPLRAAQGVGTERRPEAGRLLPPWGTLPALTPGPARSPRSEAAATAVSPQGLQTFTAASGHGQAESCWARPVSLLVTPVDGKSVVPMVPWCHHSPRLVTDGE